MLRVKALVGSSALAVAWWVSAMPLSGQTVERNTTITGPGGRTVERQVEIQRKPGSVTRDIQIKHQAERMTARCKSSALPPEFRGVDPCPDPGRGRRGFHGPS